MVPALSSLFDLALWLFAPPTCAACDQSVRPSVAFCAACAGTIERCPPGELAPFLFGGALAVAIRRLKYHDRPELAAALGALMAGAVVDRAVDAHIVVPVPLHPRRLADRGFNQSALLGRSLAGRLGVSLDTSALRRRRDTPPQAGLSRRERLDNMQDAFIASDAVAGRRVLLVDDVVTTGATLTAAERALTAAGATVAQAALALADAPGQGPKR